MSARAATPELAIVTGASRGIGLAIAERLAADGFHLLLIARDANRLARARAGLRAPAGAVHALAKDLRDRDAGTDIARTAAPLAPLAVLVNNAGTAPSDKVERTTDAALDEVLDLHVRAPLALIRALLPAFRARGRGCIVQVASTAALRGYAYTSAYSAAKAGMVGLTRALAAELRATGAAEVKAYALCPGFVDTEVTRSAAAAIAARGRIDAAEATRRLAAQNRIGRMHTPAEVAAAVARLVHERPAGCVLDLDRDPPMMLDEGGDR